MSLRHLCIGSTAGLICLHHGQIEKPVVEMVYCAARAEVDARDHDLYIYMARRPDASESKAFRRNSIV